MADAVLGKKSGLNWRAFADDYDFIRARIERVVARF